MKQGKLGGKDGQTMATFTLEAEDFNWIFGLGGDAKKEIFPTPVYAFRRGPAGVYAAPRGFVINTFAVIGGEPTYKMWVGGQDTDQVGAYTLTTTTEPVSNTCERFYRVYLQGDGPGDGDRYVSFTATRRADIYVEVISAPDVTSPYTVTIDAPTPAEDARAGQPPAPSGVSME